MSLKDVLATLDELMAKVCPTAAGEMADGADKEDIKEIIDDYADQLKDAGVKFPKELRELFAWHDGSDGESFIGELYLLDIEESLSTWAELTEMIGTDFELENWWHQGWFPFASNGGGDYVCVDTFGVADGEPGQIIRHWHDDDERQIEAESLEDWFAVIVEAYQAVALDEDEDEDELDDEEHDADDDDDDEDGWWSDDEAPDEPDFDSRTFTAGPAKAKPVF